MPGGIHHITLSPSRFGRRCRWSCKMGKSSENSFSCTASHIFLFFVFPALFDCFCVFFFLSDGFWSLTTFGGKRNSKKKKLFMAIPAVVFVVVSARFVSFQPMTYHPPATRFPPPLFLCFPAYFLCGKRVSGFLVGGRWKRGRGWFWPFEVNVKLQSRSGMQTVVVAVVSCCVL